MNPHQVERLYHSVAVLLQDGRVACLGGDARVDATLSIPYSGDTLEIFSPPQLFKDPRPAVLSFPSQAMQYGQAFPPFTVRSTVNLAAGGKVTLIRAASVTHHFDSGARWVRLEATITQTVANQFQVTVVPPPSGDYAPPGWYLLFVVTSNGTPSLGKWVQVL
ncbi:MAG: galactose oxidase early set domain-containing protein [Planctomycetota bacterium]